MVVDVERWNLSGSIKRHPRWADKRHRTEAVFEEST